MMSGDLDFKTYKAIIEIMEDKGFVQVKKRNKWSWVRDGLKGDPELIISQQEIDDKLDSYKPINLIYIPVTRFRLNTL